MNEVRGITWNHTRGFLPMAATAQRFCELHPDVEIRWEKRSLQQFADWPIERLAEHYDLLVIDHPFAGYAAGHDVLLPLDEHISSSFLADQAANSTGLSHSSYLYGEHQWALAIDAATPVCGFRRDLLERAGATLPSSWEQLLELARRGLVAVPAIGIDSLMNFYMLCGALGEDPFTVERRVVSEDTGMRALAMLQELAGLCDAGCLRRNPIATWNLLSSGDTVALCPFAYGYSNYSRRGYSRHVLEFSGLLHTSGGRPFRSTLGGAGLAISSRCARREQAIRYCEYVAGPECQRTLYFDSGGQPGHRGAWVDEEVNRRCGNYFTNTLATLDESYLRPRYEGYLRFQDEASKTVHAFLLRESGARETLAELDRLYNESRHHHATA
jgi:multiple sugar transport system substrate-binding protein